MRRREAPLNETTHTSNGRSSTILVARCRRPNDGTAIVEFTGEVDLNTEEVLRAALLDAARTPHLRLLVCALTAVTFFSCGGLNVLLDIRDALRRRGALLRVVASSPVVVLVFEVTNLRAGLSLCTSIEEALRSPEPTD